MGDLWPALRGMQHRVLLRQIGRLTEKWHFHISLVYPNKIGGGEIADK